MTRLSAGFVGPGDAIDAGHGADMVPQIVDFLAARGKA